MVRLAAFGGVYSNHLALAAVLEDIERRGADWVWCLGDLGGFGPHPDRAAEILRGAGISMLRGNYDDSIGNDRADCACGYTDPRDNGFAQISYDYTVARTSSDHKAWMRGLPERHRIEAPGQRVPVGVGVLGCLPGMALRPPRGRRDPLHPHRDPLAPRAAERTS